MIAALVYAAAAVLWAMIAVYVGGGPLVVLIATAALALAVLMLVGRFWARTAGPSSGTTALAQRFGTVFAVEGALIGISSGVAVVTGNQRWIPVLVAVIVGGHLFPIAALFDTPLDYPLGATLVVGAVATPLLVASDDGTEWAAVVGSIAAAVLLLASFGRLVALRYTAVERGRGDT